jgi:hypothetical protein
LAAMGQGGRFDQRLPLPVGGRNPIRRYRRLWFAAGRDRLRLAVLGVGVIAAALGGYFGTRPPLIEVAMTDQYYQVGSITLPSRGKDTYQGPEGAVVVEVGKKTTTAGAATNLHGVPMRGSCTMRTDGSSEHCQFRLGDQVLTATDTRTSAGWHRRYQDGQTVDLGLPAGPVPVPFAIGR